ncbi:HTH_Tnp_Tc3_2 domain-containing protein [Trichonephila clavipes]|nr:HTH_Tnp_Tc3_2 domain-containing protein [Trichonephila clavipes]
MSQNKAAIVAACLILEIWYSEILIMTCRYHLTEELRWRAIGRLEIQQSQVERAGWLNVSPSVIHKFWQQFLTTDLASKMFSQGRSRATTSDN